MKHVLQSVLVTGMMFLYSFSFGQSQETVSPNISTQKTAQESYVHFFVNAIGTNLYYGDANSGLADFKKPALGITTVSYTHLDVYKRQVHSPAEDQDRQRKLCSL